MIRLRLLCWADYSMWGVGSEVLIINIVRLYYVSIQYLMTLPRRPSVCACGDVPPFHSETPLAATVRLGGASLCTWTSPPAVKAAYEVLAAAAPAAVADRDR